MSDKTINLDAAVKIGWQIVTKNLLFYVGMILLLFLINFGESFIEQFALNQETNLSTIFTWVLYVAFFIINILISLGFIKIALEFAKGNKPKFADLFSCGNLIGKSFVAGLLVGLITMAPVLIPLIAFGITFFFPSSMALNIVQIILGLLGIAGAVVSTYFALRFMFTQYFIVDKNSGIVESLELSSKATLGVKWQLILFVLILMGIMILGFIALFVGILVAIPITMVASAAVYLQLSGQNTAVPPVKAEAK
ncbi:MAG: hypothetical protein PHE24_06265 [Patescibacteria group bacterium]|nr:hypothetical protein [Patescibacteria group bacterium]